MPGKASRERYLQANKEVADKVTIALQHKDYRNPYPENDRRHARFKRELFSRMAWDD